MAHDHIREHHRRAIDKVTAHFAAKPEFLAVIAGGSVAKGLARDDSDIDLMLVVTDEEFALWQERGDFYYYSQDFTDYEGGYIDAKVFNLAFMKDVAENGSEPARSAFLSCFVTHAKIDGLEELIAKIVTYPEADRQSKIESFYSQVMLLGHFFVREAVKRGDPYLLSHSASDLALYGSRLILAHNRIIYPYHKWLTTALEKAPEKPEGFVDLMKAVVENPGAESALAFTEAITNFRDWGLDFKGAVNRFIKDNEWNWRDGRPPLEDC
jgi:predicted nucleotidyltransferase